MTLACVIDRMQWHFIVLLAYGSAMSNTAVSIMCQEPLDDSAEHEAVAYCLMIMVMSEACLQLLGQHLSACSSRTLANALLMMS